MKRLFKKNRQRGFTLLETMLSVAIMVIISTMLLNGFAATMGYSYHTSVYAKSAASNYGYCMTSLSDLHSKNQYSNVDELGNEVLVKNNYYYAGAVALGKDSYTPTGAVAASSTSKVTIKFNAVEGSTVNAKGVDVLNPLNATEFAYTAVPTGLEVGGIIENASVAANRRTFFYYPTYNCDPDKIDSVSGDSLLNEAYLGHINIYLYNTGTYSGKYVWGYWPDTSDADTFVAVSTPFSMTPLADETEDEE